MGRTLPPFRPALEFEIESWKEFGRGLREKDKGYFDAIMNHARIHADAGSLTIKGVISEIILMSISLEHEKEIAELKREIAELKREIASMNKMF